MELWMAIDGGWLRRDMHAYEAGAVDTFCRRVRGIRDRYQPNRLLVCWDSPVRWRREIFPEYKHGRPPNETAMQLAAQCDAILDSDGIITLEVDGYEADDLLAGFASDALGEGWRAVLCSSDKDLRQCLIPDRVSLCTSWSRSKGGAFFTADDLMRQFGLRPDQWVDYQCLVGDGADNVTGARGIGEKTAKSLLQAWGSLDAMLENKWRLAERLVKSLEELEGRLDVVRQLLTLRPPTGKRSNSCANDA